MKKIYKVLTLVIVALSISLPLAAQCKSNPSYIYWLSAMFRVQFTITEPKNITFATKPKRIYEVPFGFMASISFVKAGNVPYFYLWTKKNAFGQLLDIKKGDHITFYLTGGSKIESSCYHDYPGISGQTISFYELQKENLIDLETTSVDSILVQSHLRQTKKSQESKVEDELLVLKLFSNRSLNLIKKSAKCLKENL